MNKIKFILINIELLLMVVSFILGTGAAESKMWLQAYLLIFAPFIWGWLTNFEKQIHFYEVYERAWNIKLKTK